MSKHTSYTEIYEYLYQHGYHKDTNIGRGIADIIVEHYDFSSILDVGCSQGQAVKYYQDLGKDAYGIDVAPTAIEKCKELGLTTCTVGSVLSLPYKTGEFDAVVTSDVLEHLEERHVLQAISEVNRVSSNYVFVRVSKSLESDTQWSSLLQRETCYNVKNLHQVEFPYSKWKFLFGKFNLLFIRRLEKRVFVFQKMEKYLNGRL